MAATARNLSSQTQTGAPITVAVAGAEVVYQTTAEGPPIVSSMLEMIRLDYIAIAKDEIAKAFPDGPDTYTLVVDGKTDGDINKATLHGQIRATSGAADVVAIRKAYETAIARINTSIFKRSKGGYVRSLTIRQNGRQVASPNWQLIFAGSNIQIYPAVAYASFLETIYTGNLLAAAAAAARVAGGGKVAVTFGYSTGRKLKQIREGRGGGTFPYIEIGSADSNVSGTQARSGTRRKRRRKPGKKAIST